jgi:hypothetical protein
MTRFSAKSLLRALIPAAMLMIALALPRAALAANGAVLVDDTDIDPVGTCKVDSWASFADNRDRLGVVSPGCVFRFGVPTDVTFNIARGRFGGDWGSAATVKIRTLRFPSDGGRFSVLFSAAAAYDLSNGELADVLVNIPATFQVMENFKINLNAGWLHNVPGDFHWATWGAGFDWSLNNRFSLIGEAFGLIGERDPDKPHQRDPRAQLALRFKPNETVDFDVIYGRNIFGENAHWITVGLNVRFNAFGESVAANQPTTPLYRK